MSAPVKRRSEPPRSSHGRAALLQRLDYFTSRGVIWRRRQPVHHFLGSLREAGEVAVFGGMLRDLYMMGNRSFSSDIDLVVRGVSEGDFNAIARRYQARHNSFGGLRMRVGEWDVDLWQLENTWAFKQGYCDAYGFRSLLRTTFFTWDGFVYELGDKSLHHLPSVFSDIDDKLLELNLAANPNPLGALLRTLRFIARGGVTMGPKLTRWAADMFTETTTEQILAEEARKRLVTKSQANIILTSKWLDDVREAMASHVASSHTRPFHAPSLPLRQVSLLDGAGSVRARSAKQLALPFTSL